MNNYSRCFITVVLITTSSFLLNAQPFYHDNDHVLNYMGTSRITIATGIPYVAIAEYAYGFSDRITVGILWGITPNVEGYGVRARAVLYQQSYNFRIYFCTPILFYPGTKELGGEAWWLTRPNINFEWIKSSGFRYKIGGSIIAASSHHTLFGESSRAKFAPGIWNAVHGGVSFPINSSIMFQCETSLVMSGLNIAGTEWVGGPPVILVIGFSYTM